MEEYVDELIEWVRTEVKPMTKAEIKRIRAEAYRTSPELQKLGKEVKTLEMIGSQRLKRCESQQVFQKSLNAGIITKYENCSRLLLTKSSLSLKI